MRKLKVQNSFKRGERQEGQSKLEGKCSFTPTLPSGFAFFALTSALIQRIPKRDKSHPLTWHITTSRTHSEIQQFRMITLSSHLSYISTNTIFLLYSGVFRSHFWTCLQSQNVIPLFDSVVTQGYCRFSMCLSLPLSFSFQLKTCFISNCLHFDERLSTRSISCFSP